jgi:hypothetical protein
MIYNKIIYQAMQNNYKNNNNKYNRKNKFKEFP